MKHKSGRWLPKIMLILIVTLALDIILRINPWQYSFSVSVMKTFRVISSGVMRTTYPAAAYLSKEVQTEAAFYPSLEDLEAVNNENSAAVYADMAQENADAIKAEESAASRAGGENEKSDNAEETMADITTMAAVPAGEVYSKAALADTAFLISHFYVVDPSTSVDYSLMEGSDMVDKDLSMDISGDEPKILIYHTHSQEAYEDSRLGNMEDTVVGVGDYLTEILEKQYGIAVYHDSSVYDVIDGREDRNEAYSKAEVSVEQILAENPSIKVVIDLHRDGVKEEVHLTKEVNGKATAQIMFLNGMCRNSSGSINGYIQNPNLLDNLAFSLQLQLKGEAYFPGFVRHIYLRAYRYNMHMKPRSLLVEVGAQNNTVSEAKNAMEPFAAMLNAVLSGE